MLLVDASIYIFRAYHALPTSITGRGGAPVNAVYGFAGFLAGLLASERPSALAVAFDESLETSFRNQLYPAYKANRAPAPRELKDQIGACQALVAALGIVGLASEHYEADDLIGSLAAGARRDHLPVTIVSSDKDLAQLLAAGDTLYDYARGLRLDGAAIRARYGVGCEQMVDYLALVGDPVDNIPGVAGIGAKSASALLQAFRDLDRLYANLGAVAALPLRGAARLARGLEAGRDSAFVSRQLARIVTDVPLPAAAASLEWHGPQDGALDAWCDEFGLGAGLRRRLAALEPSP